MSPIKIRNAAGEVVQTSQNLRGIVERARVVGVDRVDVWYSPGSKGVLGVTFSDDSYTVVQFASSEVLRGYISRSRWVKRAKTLMEQQRS